MTNSAKKRTPGHTSFADKSGHFVMFKNMVTKDSLGNKRYITSDVKLIFPEGNDVTEDVWYPRGSDSVLNDVIRGMKVHNSAYFF